MGGATALGGAAAVRVHRAEGLGPAVLACEHASNAIPDAYGDLGLPPEARTAHVAWDPGALGVALAMAERLDAPLVAGAVSRLVYDVNRPPEADSAIPVRSETVDVPGNRGLTAAQRAARAAAVYAPFRAALEAVLDARAAERRPTALITVHSFTPVWHGRPRGVRLGVLHDADPRLADALLARLAAMGLQARRNEPYGPADGVTHTLRAHALPRGLPNAMLEIANDLIAEPAAQAAMGARLAEAAAAALADLRAEAAAP